MVVRLQGLRRVENDWWTKMHLEVAYGDRLLAVVYRSREERVSEPNTG